MIEYFPSHGKWFAPPISDLIRSGALKNAPCQRNAIEPAGGWRHAATLATVDKSRRGRKCLSLGVLDEPRRPGCSGYMQRWTCQAGLQAVPGGSCQGCEQFVDDGPF